ncbi:MAG: hypothetical protein QG671_1657, partial [Actinomycetota bacterium]|nr:hypothetical protein [Actinomycetota bacterium]
FAAAGVCWLPGGSPTSDFLAGAGFAADGAPREVALNDDGSQTLALIRLAMTLTAAAAEPAG